MSINTPHLGVIAPKKTPHRSWINLASIAGQSQSELVFEDRTNPILAQMAQPESEFYQALKLFDKRITIGTADYDTIIPSASATICAGTQR